MKTPTRKPRMDLVIDCGVPCVRFGGPGPVASRTYGSGNHLSDWQQKNNVPNGTRIAVLTQKEANGLRRQNEMAFKIISRMVDKVVKLKSEIYLLRNHLSGLAP